MDELGRVPLKALLELARLGTMTAVAQSLGYTPGAISQQVARLETAVGMPLVTKVGRGVRLTDAGRVLADHAEAVLRAEDTAVAAVLALRTTVSGRLTIGIFGSAGAALLAPLVVALAERHPGIDVRSQEVEVDDSAAAVRRGQVDLAFGVDYGDAPIPRDPDVHFARLRTERFVLAVPPALAGESPVDLAAAAGWPWILTPGGTHFGRAIRHACRAVGFEPRVLHEVTDTAVCLALADAGLGVTPVTPLMLTMSRSSTPVVDVRDEVLRHLVLMCHRSERDRPMVRAAATAVRGVVDGIGADRVADRVADGRHAGR